MIVSELVEKLLKLDQNEKIFMTAVGLVIASDTGQGVSVVTEFLYEPSSTKKESN